QDTHPYADRDDPTRFDISKLEQWEQVFDHAQRHGINLNVVLNEAESGNKNFLGGRELTTERKLFYRELAARFGHHNGLNWNLSEEYNRGLELSPDDIRAFADYLDAVDAYDHPTTVHNGNFGQWPDNTAFADQHSDVSSVGQRNEVEPFLGDMRIDLTSYQNYNERNIGNEVEYLRERSAFKGRPIPVMVDEPESPDAISFDNYRKELTWDIYLSGGSFEVFIRQQDQGLEDFREFEQIWDEMAIARNFVEDNLPFWEMDPADELLDGEDGDFGGGEVFALPGEVYAIYLPDASNDDNDDTADGSPTLDLIDFPNTDFFLRWFDPRTGEFVGEQVLLEGGTLAPLGYTPDGVQATTDWAALVTPVPEPAALGLLGIGSLMLRRLRR
ncbi:MAG: hypothetical protein AAF656_09095, partial [Planctomycetota bacterium]